MCDWLGNGALCKECVERLRAEAAARDAECRRLCDRAELAEAQLAAKDEEIAEAAGHVESLDVELHGAKQRLAAKDAEIAQWKAAWEREAAAFREQWSSRREAETERDALKAALERIRDNAGKWTWMAIRYEADDAIAKLAAKEGGK